MLEWIRELAPDLRIARRQLGPNRHFFARFSFRGQVFDVQAREPDDPNPALMVVARCADILRAAYRMPPVTRTEGGNSIERQILAAELRGDKDEVGRLELELISGRRNTSAPVGRIAVRKPDDRERSSQEAARAEVSRRQEAFDRQR